MCRDTVDCANIHLYSHAEITCAIKRLYQITAFISGEHLKKVFIIEKMPKNKTFRLSFVRENMINWTEKAKELRKVASKSYKNVREYIPKYLRFHEFSH